MGHPWPLMSSFIISVQGCASPLISMTPIAEQNQVVSEPFRMDLHESRFQLSSLLEAHRQKICFGIASAVEPI